MRFRWSLMLGLVVVALLVPGLMITVARVFEPDGGRWVRLVSFTPYAVPLYGLALVLLLVAVAAGRGFWRGASGLLCALVLPLLLVHGWWASGPYVGQPTASAAGGEVITVMASNLSFGDADPARVVEVAVHNKVDVLVLSEITPDALAGLRAAGLDRALPHSRGESRAGVSGTMVFSRYELGPTSSLGTTFGGLVTTVAVPGGGVRLLAVHPHPPTGDALTWRRDHAVVRAAATRAEPPTVIAGDFNATMDHRPMRELAGRGFADAAEQADSGWQPTWPAAGQVSLLGVPVPSMLTIDHVLSTQELVATHTQSVTIRGTDHRAVVATLAPR